jgi:uncharacterized SAM-binding protein YcdF (DUF218 family)
MIFIVSKLFWIVFEPANLLLLILMFGLWRMMRTRRCRGMALVGFAAWSFLAIAVLPIGQWMILPLEDRFPSIPPPEKVDGIIELGGSLDPDITLARGQPALDETAERVTATLTLARRYPQARVVLSGGSADILLGAPGEAAATRDLLTAMGLPENRILVENRSRTTYENALYSKELARPKPGEVWLLVTSAAHMPRAVGCFRRLVWEVTPFPVDYQAQPGLHFVPILLDKNLVLLNKAMHEWTGLVVYRLLGRTDALFPRP